MMLGTILTVVMAAGGSADALAQFQVKNVSLQVPAAWSRSVEDGSNKFSAPSGDAYFLVDVGAVQTRISAKPRVRRAARADSPRPAPMAAPQAMATTFLSAPPSSAPVTSRVR